LNLDSDSHQHQAVRKRMFELEREFKAPPKVPQLQFCPERNGFEPLVPLYAPLLETQSVLTAKHAWN
jgi:hypothetical protein